MLVCVGCGSPLPSEAVEGELRGYFEDLGIEPRSVRCPPLRRELGATVVCEADIDDERVEMIAELTAERGTLSLRPKEGTLDTATVESEIAQTVAQRGHAVERVRCRGRLWVVRPGARHHCEIELSGGGRLAWTGTFTGEGSKLRVEIEPQPRGAEDRP